MLFNRISKQNPFFSPKNKRRVIIVRFDLYTFWLLVWIGVPQTYYNYYFLFLYDLKMRFRTIGVHLKLSTQPKPCYQKQAANMILAASNQYQNLPQCFYIDGPGGTGKSNVFKTIYFLQLEQVKNWPQHGPTTGAVPTRLTCGATAHKNFTQDHGHDVPLQPDSVSCIKSGCLEAKVLSLMYVQYLSRMKPPYWVAIRARKHRRQATWTAQQ